MSQLARHCKIVKLHEVTLSFSSTAAVLCERFDIIFGHLPPADAPAGIRVDWQLLSSPTAPLPPPAAPVISQTERVSYYGTAETVYIHLPKYGLLTVTLPQLTVTGLITPNCLSISGAFEDILMIGLAPLYRRRRWFPLHAFSALAPTGQAVLITGPMGSGKTTTGLALLDAGWKLLSNDSPLLATRNNQVEALAYPGQLSAFADSLARFESLKPLTTIQPQPTNREKHVFRAETVFAAPWAEAGPVGAVFLPQVVPGLTASRLVRLTPAAALLGLMPQAIDGWDRPLIAPTLQLLHRLVEQAPCYTLELSPQVAQLPVLLAQGLQAA